ncbi:hypothetical protein [Hymenobacter metallicola]|nr:hypothetical protein [Hymenobacter metallicola]
MSEPLLDFRRKSAPAMLNVQVSKAPPQGAGLIARPHSRHLDTQARTNG